MRTAGSGTPMTACSDPALENAGCRTGLVLIPAVSTPRPANRARAMGCGGGSSPLITRSTTAGCAEMLTAQAAEMPTLAIEPTLIENVTGTRTSSSGIEALHLAIGCHHLGGGVGGQ